MFYPEILKLPVTKYLLKYKQRHKLHSRMYMHCGVLVCERQQPPLPVAQPTLVYAYLQCNTLDPQCKSLPQVNLGRLFSAVKVQKASSTSLTLTDDGTELSGSSQLVDVPPMEIRAYKLQLT